MDYKKLDLFKETLIQSCIYYRLAYKLSKVKESHISTGFLVLHEHLYIKNFILEFSCLVGGRKNDSISLKKIINCITEDLKNKKKYNDSSKEFLNDILAKLDKHQYLFNKIEYLRDKLYAHKDTIIDLNEATLDLGFKNISKALQDISLFYLQIIIFLELEIPIDIDIIKYHSAPLERELDKIFLKK